MPSRQPLATYIQKANDQTMIVAHIETVGGSTNFAASA